MRDIVSVIVPIYKVEEYLEECIGSIVNQSYRDLEIILIDDGSPDKCPNICDTWGKKDSRIKVIHKKNGGLSDARNAGLNICSGKYIAFVDSDDMIRPNMIELLMSTLKREKADICACNINCIYPDKEISWGTNRYTVGNSERMLGMLYSDSEFPVCVWNKVYKRELFDTIRFPKGKTCEDAFTMYLLLHKAQRIVQITDALYCYRIRSDSIMTSSFSKRSMDEEEAWRMNYEFMRVHYPILKKKAYTFYLQSVNILIHKIKIEQRSQFSEEYEYLRTILLRNSFFMLFLSSASLKYRIRYLLDLKQL